VNPRNFFAELKRRNVYKVAVAYAVAGWALSQGIAQVLPVFDIPNWVIRLIVLLIIIGLPIALVLAWMFELTPQGIKRTEDVDLVAAAQQPKKRTWIFVVIIGALLSIGLFFLGRYSTGNTTASPAGITKKSIAVLPFANQNHDPDTEYLCDGIPESIINSLSELPKLKVMSRNSVFHYKAKETDAQTVAKELKVQTVLTGRLTQRGDALSIRVELINAEDNTQIWGQQYNRKLADVFAVQEEIAKEISEKLRSKLTGAERQQLARRPTDNLRAFQYYMQSRRFAQRRTREDLLAAISYCEKAIDEDRHYALAYAGLSEAYSNLGLRAYIAPIEGRRKAEEASSKALALDENLAEAYATLGFSHTIFVPSDFAVGDHELRRAVELSPSLAIAHQYLGVSLLRQGRFDEGLEETMKARELDPLSSVSARLVALSYYLKRDYGRAIELLRQANELGPSFSNPFEIGFYIQNKLFDEALVELEKDKGKRKSDPILICGTGVVYAAQGKRVEALQVIKELEAMSGPSQTQAHWIARIYAALNEKDLTLTWLERGLAAESIGGFYKDDPAWDPIRSDPRFVELCTKMNVPVPK
jgi:TolB-like protein/Tfp pilus assembly protein PilF